MGIQKELSEYINHEIEYWDFSGVIRVVQKGKVLFETSRGYANIAFGIKNNMRTRFSTASITKQFTAFAIMLLYDKGLVKLEEQANTYLPIDLQIASGITIHHLLSHTSGLYNFYNFEDNFFFGEDREPYDRAYFLRTWINKEPINKPGTEYNYNNANYILLSWIIENLSGQSYSEFMKTHIFMPLGMLNSGYDNGQNILLNKASNYMRDYGQLVNVPYTNNLFSIGAAELVTNCDDIQLWYECLKGQKLLSKEADNHYFTENIAHYCYGLERHENDKETKYIHGGDFLGISAYTEYIFAQDTCIIIISNTESLNQYRLGNAISKMVFGKEVKHSYKPAERVASPEELMEYVGTYLQGKIHMVLKENELYLVRVNHNIHISLYCVGEGLFMRKYEEQENPYQLMNQDSFKPSVWGYELVSKEFI